MAAMDMGRPGRISDETKTALRAVLAEESENRGQFYAWKITTEESEWLCLTDTEAGRWESNGQASVTIVAWGYANLR